MVEVSEGGVAPAVEPSVTAIVEGAGDVLEDAAQGAADAVARHNRNLVAALLFALAIGLTVAAWYFNRTASRTHVE